LSTAFAYLYGRETKADADIANVLTVDEARRLANNIARRYTKRSLHGARLG